LGCKQPLLRSSRASNRDNRDDHKSVPAFSTRTWTTKEEEVVSWIDQCSHQHPHNGLRGCCHSLACFVTRGGWMLLKTLKLPCPVAIRRRLAPESGIGGSRLIQKYKKKIKYRDEPSGTPTQRPCLSCFSFKGPALLPPASQIRPPIPSAGGPPTHKPVTVAQ
jgi:hypothetical protein